MDNDGFASPITYQPWQAGVLLAMMIPPASWYFVGDGDTTKSLLFMIQSTDWYVMSGDNTASKLLCFW